MEGGRSCVHESPPSRLSIALLFFLLLATFFVNLLLFDQKLSLIAISGITISFVLLVTTILDIWTKKDYLAVFFGCHQNTSRSFHIKHYTLPICARCTGIYIGIFAYTIILIFISPPWYVYLILGIPLIVDGLLQRFAHIPSTPLRRLVTGIMFGSVVIFLFYLYQYGLLLFSQWLLSLF